MSRSIGPSRSCAAAPRARRPPPAGVPWICIGATGEFKDIGSRDFRERLDELFAAIHEEFGCIPPIHFFRALQMLGPSFDWPVISVDSADRGRNHNRLRWIVLGNDAPGALFGIEERGERLRIESPDYLWAVAQSFDRWDILAANFERPWPPARLIKQPLLL